METKTCPICYEKIYSELGKGCKMCGMALEDKGKDFCSKSCRIEHKRIRKK